MLSARGRLVILGLGVAVAATVLAITGLPSSDEIRDWADEAGPSGPILFAAAFAAVSLLPLPLAPLSIAAGVLFGFGVALPAVYAGAMAGAAATFWIARTLGRPAVVQVSGERVARIDALVQRRGLSAIISLRLVPIVPFTLFNYACGLTAVRTRDYLLGTAIGIVPGTSAYVAAGAFGAEPTSLPFLLATGGLAVLTVGGITVSRRGVPAIDPGAEPIPGVSTGRLGRQRSIVGRMSNDEPDPGGDTEMFRAFVEREQTYQPKSSSQGPLIVAVAALVVAVIAFLVIIALG